MGAYGLEEWFRGLPWTLRDRVRGGLESGLYPGANFDDGKFEVHRSFLPEQAHHYSEVPPVLQRACQALWKKGDYEAAEVVLEEWVRLADLEGKTRGPLYAACCEAVELYWRQGYESAQDIREKGLYNAALLQVVAYTRRCIELMQNGKLTFPIESCPPLDRLFLLCKLTSRTQVAFETFDLLGRLGFGDLLEVRNWKEELSKPPKPSKSRKSP